MQKKIIALAVAGLSTAAFAQTNVTIYGVADVSAQGTTMSKGVAPNTNPADGSAFNLKNNSSLIGFKGTEDLGNGLKGLFQIETNVNMTGQSSGQGVAANTSNSNFGSLRDTYVGLNSKFGTVLGGYLSTPFRSTLTSFDVMPGATGDGRIENLMGGFRMSGTAYGRVGDITLGNNVGYLAANSSVRATAIAYAMPTLYGFNGSIAYTGSNNNGGSNQTTVGPVTTNATGSSITSQVNAAPQSALSLNLGWTGYGVNIAGAFQQAKVNNSSTYVVGADGGASENTAVTLNAQALTSYLVGASYTGIPGLKAAVVYNRNTLGTNNSNGATSVFTGGASKATNNAIYAGASYRMGNWEPRLSYQHVSNTSGANNYGGQDGANQWTANVGYYLSKRTQVYGIVSMLKNNANSVYNLASGGTSLQSTGGQSFTTYGLGMRTNF